MLVDHPFSDDENGINIRYIAYLAGNDWGLWGTTLMIGERADDFAREIPGFDHAGDVHTRTREYVDALESCTKGRSWKLRARLGDRRRWYELPEEVG